ncbi:MAG: elongation factor Tu [Thermoplasmata archaeon]|nr:elongation factor Tu [Thermoplasmata archaeon]
MNINVALIGKDYGENLGKKGTTSDITFYNVKRGYNTVTIIEASKYPEKISSLFYSISCADFVIFVVSNIDAYLGEAIISANLMEIKNGMFILKNYNSEEEIKPFIHDSNLKNYIFYEDNPPEIREFLIEMAGNKKIEEKNNGSVAIDHFFNVRGVGTVILGTVVSGSIRKHDDAILLPLNKKIHIRSIQKHDDDFDVANEGDRVGIALKNVEVDEIKRGYVLTTEDLMMSKKIKIELDINKYWKNELKEGMILHLGHWMQFMPAKVESIDEKITFRVFQNE